MTSKELNKAIIEAVKEETNNQNSEVRDNTKHLKMIDALYEYIGKSEVQS